MASILAGLWLIFPTRQPPGDPFTFFGGLGTYFIGTTLILAPLLLPPGVRRQPAASGAAVVGLVCCVFGGIAMISASLQDDGPSYPGLGLYAIGAGLTLGPLLGRGLRDPEGSDISGIEFLSATVGTLFMLGGGAWNFWLALMERGTFLEVGVIGGPGLYAIGAGVTATGWLTLKQKLSARLGMGRPEPVRGAQ